MTRALVIVLLGLSSGGVAVAQPPPPPPGGGGGYATARGTYGAAGCGLGSLLFGATPGFVQVFAATTNIVFGSQTFGITSGISNCASTGPGAVTARAFVESNREAFAKDVSRGSGETIATLATLSGCQNAPAVATSLQRNFKRIFPNALTSNTEVSAAAIGALKDDKQLACSKLI